MSELGPGPDSEHQAESRLAEELERLSGVLAASVRMAGAEVRELFIAAAEGSAGTTLRDSVAEIVRRAGLKLPPGALRIGGVAAGPAANGSRPAPEPETRPETSATPAQVTPWQSRFLLLEGVEVQRSEARVSCEVHLIRLEERFSGQCSELDTELGRARAAARATLAAAEKASPSALALEGAQIAEMFGRRYIIVSVEASAARRFLVLSGILALDGGRSLEEAAALAALRAVERFIAW